MALVDEMLVARDRGHSRVVERLAREALQCELGAATIAFDKDVSAATRLVLLRSAAHLARDARQSEAGIELAIRALSAYDLADYRDEIFRIIDTLRTYEHLRIEGVQLSDADVQLTVAGPEAAPGFARADEVTRRVEVMKKLMERTAMRRAKLPFGPPPKSHAFRSVLTPYLSPARVASYAVTLKFGIDEQWELLPDAADAKAKTAKRRPPSIARVLSDVIASAKAYAQGGPAALRKVIGDDAYAKNAAMLLKDLSPDLQRISTVGLTVVRSGRAEPVALPARDAFEERRPVWFAPGGHPEALPPRQAEFEGQLLEGSATRPEHARAAVVLDDGSLVRFHYDEATHGDVIAGYWKHRVRVRLRREGQHGHVLEDVQDA